MSAFPLAHPSRTSREEHDHPPPITKQDWETSINPVDASLDGIPTEAFIITDQTESDHD